MQSAKRINFASVATLAALSWTSPLFADESRSASATTGVVEAAAAIAPSSGLSPVSPDTATMRRSPFGSKPMPVSALATRRGGDRVFNDAKLKGAVSDNQASNLTTGSNTLSEGAFAGSSGLSTVIQNSGNNVLIQNATIVNVQLK